MCDSDEFDGGSEFASLAFSQGSRRSPRKAQKGASGRSSGSSTTPIRYLCLDPNAEKSFKGVWLHIDPCFNAVRARQMQTRADKFLAAQDIQDMKTNVARWREKHEPSMTKDPTARHAARLQVQSHILVEESVKTTSEKNISDYMILNKTRCKNYENSGTGARATRRWRTSRSSIGCKLASTTIPTTVARPWSPLRARTTCVCATRRRGRNGLAHAPRRETAIASALHHCRLEADQTIVPRDAAGSTRGDGRNASPAIVRRSRSSRRRRVSPHLLEGKGSRVNVAPSEAGPGAKFLQMK